jgi:transmembrane sensor
MANKRITQLYAKKLAGEATDEELQELASYLLANPGEQYFQNIFSNWWDSKKVDDAAIDSEQEEHFKYIMRQAANDAPAPHPENIFTSTPVIQISRKRVWKRIIAAAAISVILFFSTWKFLGFNKPHEIASVQDTEIVAKRGTQSKILLPDGTQVWLNSESRLVYNNTFDVALREVTLEGEAYFDVVKNPKKPFIVHTSGISIKVLGTEFNVKSYPQEPTIEATLVRGLIEVEKNNQPHSSKIFLHPNQKLVYNKIQDSAATNGENEQGNGSSTQAQILKPQNISIITLPKNIMDSIRIETSWIYGKLLFEGDTFRELAPKMERWFNVKINFKNNMVANYRFRGVFENENIEEALHALQLTASFKYTINGNVVTVDKN